MKRQTLSIEEQREIALELQRVFVAMDNIRERARGKVTAHIMDQRIGVIHTWCIKFSRDLEELRKQTILKLDRTNAKIHKPPGP